MHARFGGGGWQEWGEVCGEFCTWRSIAGVVGLAKYLDEGLVGNAKVFAVAPEHDAMAVFLGSPRHLRCQAGLSDAWFAEQPDPPGFAVCSRPFEDCFAVGQFVVSATEELTVLDLQLLGERRLHGWGGVVRARQVCRSIVLFDVGKKPVTPAMHGLDCPLRRPVVIDGSTGLFDPGGER